ncbi:MAG TPA: ATP-binding cassette domain-containing protein [Conexibacter sp.]|nr:ATP-binding cassette domain-containing protein [Conexibacter sp.]
MTTLVLDEVGKRFRSGAADRVALDGVSLEVDAGEVVGVWGRRRSGRTTLLRVAAGIEQPNRGAVRVDGVDLWNGARRQRRAVRQRIAVWYPLFLRDHGRRLYRQVAIPTRRGRRSTQRAWADAHAALERVGIADCARTPVAELDHRETARAALARALVMRPRLLVLDEPMAGLGALEGERLMELVVEIARADRVAVVVSASEVGQLAGVDRHLSIAGGVLRGATVPTPAEVIELRRTESRG